MHFNCNAIFPSESIPAPAQEIAARFCTENINSPNYEKIKELETFNFYDQLRIRRTVDERDKGKPNVPICYEVTSRAGHPIFRAVQTLEHSDTQSDRPSSSKPFQLSIFDMRSGNEVLKVVAKQGADSVVVFARQKHLEYHGIGKILRIKQGSALRGPDYNVRGSSGKVVLKVNGGFCFLYKKTKFDLCTPDNSQCYGKIHKQIEDDPRDRDRTRNLGLDMDDMIYKIKFPIDISMVTKALVLATTLVMDYDYFDCGSKEAKADFFLLSGALAFATFVVVMLVVIISVSVTTKLGSLSRSNVTRIGDNELDQQFEFVETNHKKRFH